jgi:hypothetical protein
MKPRFKAVAIPVVSSSLLLGGCAVYTPPPAYSQGPYYEAAPVYVQPAPVYVAPPPVSLGLHFGYWGGRRHGWGGYHR